VSEWKLRDGTPITIRPICPEDEPLMVKFHQTLSDESVQTRYFHTLKLDQRVAHERLVRVCFSDYDRQIALVGARVDPTTGRQEIIGVGRLSKTPHTADGEFAILVSDAWQNRGLGARFLALIIDVAREEGLQNVFAEILPYNLPMQRLCRKRGFEVSEPAGDGVLRAKLALGGGDGASSSRQQPPPRREEVRHATPTGP
jgi:acetyltransferase